MAKSTSKPTPIVGRRPELKLLDAIWRSKRPELIAVYGRRRVGKTHLCREYFSSRADVWFELTGQRDASVATQLHHFRLELQRAFYGGAPLPELDSWDRAFALLCDAIERAAAERPSARIAVFLDELPWLASPRSGLLESLDYHWNTRLSRHPGLRFIVCGSAASWMLEKLVHAKGGLHNRLTRRILLRPFELAEAKEYLDSLGVRLGPERVLELYLAVGGIPYYLQQFQPGKSAPQNIAAACFDRSGALFDEFERLFASLFSSSDAYETLVRAIAKKRSGVLRDELIASSGVASGGRLASRLRELEEAGFIASLVPYGKKRKQVAYRLIDEYVWFWLKWIEKAPRGILAKGGADWWIAKSQTPGYRAWAGYAFEGICLKHVDKIVKELGISGVAADVGTWRHVPTANEPRSRGAEIDLLIDRADGVVNLCELKYSSEPFAVTKAYARELRRKAEVFRERTGTKKELVWTLVAPHGVAPGPHVDGLIDSSVALDALFA